jgi:NAD(P)H dehydrogenase (quinone)
MHAGSEGSNIVGSINMAEIGVIGATGALGTLVVKGLVAKIGGERVLALARSPEKAAGLGIAVRHADYDKPETLVPALKGVEKLLFISSPDVGRRTPQHAAVVEAAKAAGTPLLPVSPRFTPSGVPRPKPLWSKTWSTICFLFTCQLKINHCSMNTEIMGFR